MNDSTRNTPPSNAISAAQAIPSVILAGMALPPGDNELVQIMDAALLTAALRAGAWLVCRPGCTQCCHGAFAINELDAQRLAVGMETLRSQNPALAANLQRRARIWLYEHGSGFPGDPGTGRLGDTDDDRARFEDYANQAPCPALDPATGRCDVYEWRPMTCRVFGPPVRVAVESPDTNALGHCELCFSGATTAEIAACEMSVPHDLEERLLNEIPAQGETIVAFALLR
jgi:Fe-S-cluster containining protein